MGFTQTGRLTDRQAHQRRNVMRVPLNAPPERDHPHGHEDRGESRKVQAMLWGANAVVAPRKTVHNVVAQFSGGELTYQSADEQGHAGAGADGTGVEVVFGGVDFGHGDGGEDVDAGVGQFDR